MKINLDLIKKVKIDSHEFRKLYDDHRVLKIRVDKMNKWKFLLPEQEIEKKTMQKKKLQKKDRMNEIIGEYDTFLC